MYNSGQIHNTNLSTTIYNLYNYPHSKIDTIPLLRTYYLPFCTILSISSLLLLCTGTTIINANSFDPIKAKKSTYPDVHSKTGVLVVDGSSLPFWDFWVLLVCSTMYYYFGSLPRSSSRRVCHHQESRFTAPFWRTHVLNWPLVGERKT